MTSFRTPFPFVVCLLASLIAARSASAQTIPIARADVDRDCTVTRTDATIVAAQLGKRTGQAGFNPNADVDQNGVVNNVDVTFVTRNVGQNVCAPPPPAPTIAATLAPPANTFGWHRTPVVVSFACTNAVSCPSPVTVSSEGASQVVARTVANSAGVTASASVSLNLDFTPPVLAVTTPSVVAPGASVTLPVTATDLSGLATTSLVVQRAIVTSRTSAPFSLAWTLPASLGAGTLDAFEIVGEDRAGNVAAVRRPFSVAKPDTTLPTVSLGAPATAGPGATVPLTIRAADDRGSIARVVVSRNVGGTVTVVEDRAAGPFAFQSLGQIPAGAASGAVVTFVAVATDASGNAATASANVQVVTSVTKQTLQITVNPPVSPTFQADGVITGTIGRGSAVVPPPATPIIASVTPLSGGQGQSVTLTITGVNTNFGGLTQVTLGTGVTVQSVTATSPTSVTARLAIASGASLGPRLVAVSSGTEEAILSDAFSVVAGTGAVNGRVVTSTAQGIANAQICQPVATSACVASNATGAFAFTGVPVDVRRVVVTASGFEPQSVPVAVTPNGTSTVGDIVLAPANQPPPPPPPSSPPIAPALAVVLGRGATESLPGGNPDQMKLVVRDAFLAAGGQEIGVLDANGQQLNPKMLGAGYVSVTDAAVEDIAKEMVFGQTMTLAKLLTIYMGSLDLPGVRTPSLARTIQALQARVNAVWADPALPEAPLVMLLFNSGRTASVTPPTLTFDTELNALQVNLATVAFMTAVTRYLPEGQAPPFTSLDPALAAPHPGLWDRTRGLLASLVPSFGGRWPAASLTGGVTPVRRGDRDWTRGLRPVTPARQNNGGSTPATRPGSVFWGGVLSTVLDGVQSQGWNVAKKSGGLCDTFLVTVAQVSVPGGTPEGVQAAQDPNASFLPTPNCTNAIELAELLVTASDSSYVTSANNLKAFMLGNQATAKAVANAEKAFATQAYQQAWDAAKAEARQIGLVNGLISQAGAFVEGGLSKIQGAVVDKLLEFEAQLVIQSVRPRQPFIRKVEQMFDPTQTPAAPSHIVKIWFDRSPNDKGAKNDPAVDWRYRLYRGVRGDFRPVAMKRFKDGDEIAFTDVVPADGTYAWVVIGVRQMGVAIDDPPPANWLLEWIGGFFDTTLKIGEGSAQRAVLGLEVVKTVTQPMAQIYRGIRYQTSDPSDPQMFYVSTTPPAAKPPASLAVWKGLDLAFASVPALDSIFVRANGEARRYAVPNFKAPGAVGLAISGSGTLYTDNSASDAQFGGRIFSFAPTTGARDLAGTVNYFSQLLMFANPVSVSAMTVATGPFGANLSNFYEESLFIADAQNQRITRMTLPSSLPAGYPINRNVSQPWVSSPLFAFGPDTALAMASNNRMAITQGNDILLATPPGPWATPTSVDPLFGSGSPSPFARLSGVTFDGRTNLYVSDSVQGTLSTIPAVNAAPRNGLFGLTTVQRKKLMVERGLLRPSDVKLNGVGDGLIYYDGERLFAETRFGMSGQVVDQSGAPLSGAVVQVPSRRTVAVTDTDGVYVMPNLVKLGESSVVDFTVKYQGQTRSFTRTLDVFTHNIVDVVFSPPAPLPPDPPTPPVAPTPPTPRKTDKSDAQRATIAVEFDLDPTAPPPPPPAQPSLYCPRGVILTPAYGAATASASVTVTGMVSNKWAFGTTTVPTAFLIVNGNPTPVTLNGLEFTTTTTLGAGDNTLEVAFPASVLKPIGCAPQTALDTDPISISGAHRVFHDPDQADVDAYRRSAGWDVATRAIVRTGGVPLAGLDFMVPGTDIEATTDGDGVMQLNLDKATMAGATVTADQISDGVFTDVGVAVANIRADQNAQSIAALQGLVTLAVSAADAPPSAATTVDAIVDRLAAIQHVAIKLLQALEAQQIPSPADVAALEQLGLQFASTKSNGEIVVQARDYPGLTITVKVQ